MKLKTATLSALILAQQLSLMADITMKVDCSVKEGTIKQELAGASQGGNALSYLKPEIVAGLKGLPLKIVRLEMVTGCHKYKLYDPKTRKWDWTVLDKEIEAIKKSGAKIVINLFGTPKFMSSNPKAKIPIFAPPVDFDAYAAYCAEIVRHVNIDKKYDIKYWEFWNEPSGNFFWSAWRKPDNGGFFKLYAKTVKAIKAVDPSILVGGFGDNAYFQAHYKTFFGFAKRQKLPIDFLTVHWYGDWSKWTKSKKIDTQNYNTFAAKLEKTYKEFFGKEVPIFYSEWNLPAESRNQYSAEQIAAYAGMSLYWMQATPYVKAAMLFRVQHYKDPYSSLVDKNYKPNVLWNVMKMFTMLPKEIIRSTSDSSCTNLLAASDRSTTGIMINRYSASKTADANAGVLEISGLSADKEYQLCVYNQDAAVQKGELLPIVQQTVKADSSGKLKIKLTLKKFSCVYVSLKVKQLIKGN